jgi:hypothetical protein
MARIRGMGRVRSVRCYIDEFVDEHGDPAARLREKTTGRTVDLGVTAAGGMRDFLLFLTAAHASTAAAADVFSRDGEGHCILVSGEVDSEGPDGIRFVYDETLSYLFV